MTFGGIHTPLTTLRMAEPAMEAGIPAGVFNVLPGTGPDVGEPIGWHMDIDAVSFTGSTGSGRHCLRHAAESNLRDVTPEMGGKNPAVVLEAGVSGGRRVRSQLGLHDRPAA